jgi:hypothetical protein
VRVLEVGEYQTMCKLYWGRVTSGAVLLVTSCQLDGLPSGFSARMWSGPNMLEIWSRVAEGQVLDFGLNPLPVVAPQANCEQPRAVGSKCGSDERGTGRKHGQVLEGGELHATRPVEDVTHCGEGNISDTRKQQVFVASRVREKL